MEKYKEYLQKLEYPFIEQMNDTEVANIFSEENRIFLLTWLIIKMIPAYAEQLDQAKNNNQIETTVANIIQDNGFCQASDKFLIVSHGIDTETEKQIKIFDRIFNYLSLINNYNKEYSKEHNEMKQQLFKTLTKEKIDKHLLKDINLFPTFGVYKKMNSDERIEKLKFYQNQIEMYNNLLKEAEMETINTEDIVDDLDLNDENEFKLLISKLKNTAVRFNENVMDLSTTNTDTSNCVNNTDLEQCIKKTSKKLCIPLEIIDAKSSMDEILKQNSDNDQRIESDECSNFISNNYALSKQLIQEFKEDNTD